MGEKPGGRAVSPEAFWDLAGKIGIPAAMLAAILLGNRGGVWIWSRELEQARKEFTERLADLEREMDEVRADRDYYRAIAFAALDRAEGAVSKAEQAVSVAERRRTR